MFTFLYRAFLILVPALFLILYLFYGNPESTSDMPSGKEVMLITSKPVMCAVFGIYEAILFKIWVMPYLADRIVKILYGDQNSLDETMEGILQNIREGNHDEALKALESYTASNPLRLAAWTERANLLRDSFKRPQDAVKVLEEAMEHIPGKEDKALLLYRIARIYELSLNNMEKAQNTYRLLCETYPRTTYGKEGLDHLRD